MGIYDAFYGRSDIRIMTVRHEQTTAYMADGYARRSRVWPSLCLAQASKTPVRRWGQLTQLLRQSCSWPGRSRVITLAVIVGTA